MPNKRRKKRSKNNNENNVKDVMKADIDGQLYGKVEKLLGSCHFEIMCVDGKARRCKIRGAIRKRCRIKLGDFVIVSLREFDDNSGDILHKYSSDEVRILQKEGEIPSGDTFSIAAEEKEEELGYEFDFEEI